MSNCLVLCNVKWSTTGLRKVLLLDLDGTVRRSGSKRKFIHGPDDVEIIVGVAEKIKEYKAAGFIIAAISNQAGVAYGFHTEESVVSQFHATDDPLGGVFDIAVFSFMHEAASKPEYRARSLLRKPQYGMMAVIEYELGKYKIQVLWDDSLMVGDRDEDYMVAVNAGVKFVYADEWLKIAPPKPFGY